MVNLSVRMASYLGLADIKELKQRVRCFEGLFDCTPAITVQGTFPTLRGSVMVFGKPTSAELTYNGLKVLNAVLLLTGTEQQQVTLRAGESK